MARNGDNHKGGRKTARDERLMYNVIHKCWNRIDKDLDSARLTDQEKRMIALEIVKRTAPKEIKLGNNDEKPLLVKFLEG